MEQQFKHRSFEFKAEKVTDEGTFTGYASVFDVIDSDREVVKRGAFAESLKRIKKNGHPLPMLWQHNHKEPIGGFTELEEDDRGLKVNAFLLIDAIPRARQAHALMKAQILRELSIGYVTEDEFYDSKTRVNELRRLGLMEISPVTFASNPQALIDSVKAQDGLRSIIGAGVQPTPREFEDFLRESGFSKTVAAAIVSKGYTQLFRGEPGGDKTVQQIAKLLADFKL